MNFLMDLNMSAINNMFANIIVLISRKQCPFRRDFICFYSLGTTYLLIKRTPQFFLTSLFFRPIPDEMVKYAREDTHYLLYIYDKLRTTLLEVANGQPNLIKAVYSMSKAICSKVWKLILVWVSFKQMTKPFTFLLIFRTMQLIWGEDLEPVLPNKSHFLYLTKNSSIFHDLE